jgi:putative ABC transport system ATP-binding protein
VLADEPTGNLDSASSLEIMQIFSRLNVAGRTIVMITHEPSVAEHAKRIVQLVDGRIVADRRVAVEAVPA